MGDSGEKVVDIARDWRSAGLDEQDRAILEFTEKMTVNASGITKEDIEALRSVGFADADILNIAVTAGWWNFLTRYVDALGIELEEGALRDKKFVESLLSS